MNGVVSVAVSGKNLASYLRVGLLAFGGVLLNTLQITRVLCEALEQRRTAKGKTEHVLIQHQPQHFYYQHQVQQPHHKRKQLHLSVPCPTE